MADGFAAGASQVDGFDRVTLLSQPSPFLFELEDALEIDSIGSLANVTIVVSGVMLGADGQIKPFKFLHTPASNRTLATTRQHIGSGWLLRARVAASAGTPNVGQVFVWLRTCRGLLSNAEINGVIASGYVTANTDVCYPGDQMVDPTDGAGVIRSITGSTPAAGAEIAETVPTGARWELLMFKATLITSAVVATRAVILRFDDGVNEFFRSDANFNHVASTTGVYNFGQGLVTPLSGHVGGLLAGLPINNRLPAGARIRTLTSAIDVGDQYSAVQYLVREWIEGN